MAIQHALFGNTPLTSEQREQAAFGVGFERHNNTPNINPGAGVKVHRALARALVTDPRLLLLDQPSEGLAPVMVQYVEQIIQDLKRSGLAILLVEHNLRSALLVADRVCVLESGQVAYMGLPDDGAAITRYLGF